MPWGYRRSTYQRRIKRTLIISVSVGVAFRIAIGLSKMIFDLPLVWLATWYPDRRRSTAISSEAFADVAWTA